MTDFIAEARLVAQLALNGPLMAGGFASPPPIRSLLDIESAISEARDLLQHIAEQAADLAAGGISDGTIAHMIEPELRAAEAQLSAAIMALAIVGINGSFI